MHLVRVTDLYNTGRWYDPVVIRSNAPYGERLHWSRPFDVLLLLGAVPISLFTVFESALFWWGVIISPILFAATLIALQWSTRPILSRDGPFLAGFIFAPQVITLVYYQAGRPDHHSLLIFVFVLSIGFTLRMILRPFKTLLYYIAGAIGALSIWISVESMLPVCIILGVLGLFWIVENGDFSSKNLHYNLALFIFMGLGLIFERPWNDLATPELDRLSIVHWSVIGFMSLFWITISTFYRYTSLLQRAAYRIYFILTGMATIAITIWLCFPKFYHGPIADIDPRIIPLWLSKVNEVQPLLSKSGPLTIPVQLISSAIVCFPFLFYLLFRNTHNEKWKGWIYISISLVLFISVSLYQLRWSVYAQVLLIIPLTAIMVSIRQRGPKTGLPKTLKNTLILLLFCATPLSLGLLTNRIIKRENPSIIRQEIPMVQLCEYLNEQEQQREQILRILTHVDFGPEILYRTQHEVIGTPYHRNGQGIVDTYDIMTADTDEKALELIQKRKPDLILLCPESTESIFYSKTKQTSTFYQRLLQDMIPRWLHRVELPSNLSSSFLLFEIVKE
jgi:hypothetical protein